MSDEKYDDLTKSAEKLTNRLQVNAKNQKIDFSSWLWGNMPNIFPSSNILDLGCGTGAQTNIFLNKITSSGKVVSVDASLDSLNLIPNSKKLTKIQIDFNDLQSLGKLLKQSTFDIINSTYAIYYCDEPINLIEYLRKNFLAANGKFIIAGPTWDHELYSMITREFGENSAVERTIDFMESELLPYIRSNFTMCGLHILNNWSYFHSIDEIVSFLYNTSYAASIDRIELTNFLEKKQVFKFKKTSAMAIF